MGEDSQRLAGWKSIAGYFGRDRTTVIRWAQNRGLPVHRIPGEGSSSVYALPEELDRWLDNSSMLEDADLPESPPPPMPEARGNSRRLPVALAVAGSLALLAGIAIWIPSAATDELPKDPQVAAAYVQARDNAARRTANSVSLAIRQYETLIAGQPDFAPAFAGLADAYLWSAEYGSLSYDVAYGRAGPMARRAIALDPDLPTAHRALGYVSYWWERDPVAAGESFRRAIDLDRDDAQAHFWYASILADNGEFQPSLRHFQTARALDPGSIPIEIHLALWKWRSGESAEGIADLEDIATRYPGFALTYYFLGVAYLDRGDRQGFLRTLRQRVRLRNQPQLQAQLAAVEAVERAEGDNGLKRAIFDQAMADEANRPFPDHSLPAFIGSANGDRAQLILALSLADRNRELWGSAGYVQRIAERWQDDAEIMALLRRRASPRIEPAPDRE